MWKHSCETETGGTVKIECELNKCRTGLFLSLLVTKNDDVREENTERREVILQN